VGKRCETAEEHDGTNGSPPGEMWGVSLLVGYLKSGFPNLDEALVNYLMAIHEHLTRIPKRQLREVG
jgi:hypothetical protein